MKFIKKFEAYAPAPAPAPAPTREPEPTTVPSPETPVKPERPAKPEPPGKPLTTPSIDPGPLASEKDVIERLKKVLKEKGQSLAEFVEKNRQVK